MIPILDLKRQYKQIGAEVEKEVGSGSWGGVCTILGLPLSAVAPAVT